MKVEIDVEIPEGYEATGEYRAPKKGEWYLDQCSRDAERASMIWDNRHRRLILRKKPLRYEDFEVCQHVRIDRCGGIIERTGGARYRAAEARALAAALIAAADHVDRVNAQKAGA